MSHIKHNLGLIKRPYAVLEITEHDHRDEEDVDHDNEFEIRGTRDPERYFEIEFNGYSLLHIAEAYRELGLWLDNQYAIEAGEATA